MNKNSLEKYSPLGLLALAIVAGVVAVSTHTPPNKYYEVFGEEYDAGYDVISYFYCSAFDSRDEYSLFNRSGIKPVEFVLVKEGSAFKLLSYSASPRQIEKGKPIDLSYLTPVGSEEKIGAKSYSWQKGGSTFTLDRANGNMVSFRPGKEANQPGCSGFDCLPMDSSLENHSCKFGEEGKKLFWEATVREYEAKKPKF